MSIGYLLLFAINSSLKKAATAWLQLFTSIFVVHINYAIGDYVIVLSAMKN